MTTQTKHAQYDSTIDNLLTYRVGTAQDIVLAVLVVSNDGFESCQFYPQWLPGQENEYWEWIGSLRTNVYGDGELKYRIVIPCRIFVSNRNNTHTLTMDEIRPHFRDWILVEKRKLLGEGDDIAFGVFYVKSYQKYQYVDHDEAEYRDLKENVAGVTSQAYMRYLSDHVFPKDTTRVTSVESDGIFQDMTFFFPWSEERALSLMRLCRESVNTLVFPDCVTDPYARIEELRADGTIDQLASDDGILFAPLPGYGSFHAERCEISLGDGRAQDHQEYPYDLAAKITLDDIRMFDLVLGTARNAMER